MSQLFANNFSTTVGSTFSSGATTLVLASGTGVPAVASPNFWILTIQEGATIEIVKVTACSAGATSLTVERHKEGTTSPASFTTAAVVEGRVTAESLSNRTVSVATHGAVGDGVTDDTDAFNAALATGDNVSLVAGKAYLVSNSLTMVAGQILFGNNATVKRAAQTSTTTTTGITSGVTNAVTVATGTGSNFKAGDRVSVYNGANYGTQNIVLQSVVGDVLTGTTAFALSAGSPWSGTTTVVKSYDLLVTAENCKVYDLYIDGNKSNWTKYRWETVSDIHWIGSNVTIKGCVIQNSPGDAVISLGTGDFETAATGKKFLGNTVYNCNGNGVHLSSENGTILQGNWISHCTLDAAVGHVGGCITLSNAVQNLNIIGNYLAVARCGVGEIDSSDNRKIVIQGNVFEGIALTANHVSNGYAASYAVECYSATKDNAANDIVIIGNKFNKTTPVYCASNYTASTAKTITSISKEANAVVGSTSHGFAVGAVVQFAGVVGMVEINGLSARVIAANANDYTIELDTSGFTTYTSGGTATGTYPSRYVISGNEFKDCEGGLLGQATPAAITVNTGASTVAVVGLSITNNVIHYTGLAVPGGNSDGIAVRGAVGYTISGNQVRYGHTALLVDVNSTDGSISNNVFTNQYYYGVYVGTASGLLISGNYIQNDANAYAGTYQGIALNSPAMVVGNFLNLNKGYCAIRVYGAPASGSYVDRNKIIAGAAASLVIEAGATGCTIGTNVMSKAMTYSATAGANNFGTATITAAVTSVTVTHNLGYTPLAADIRITPTLLSSSAKWWVSAIGATTFQINVDVVPGAGTATFDWKVAS